MARSGDALRFIDFTVGVPLLRLVGALRRRRTLPRHPRRITLLSPTAIGDLILQSGVLLHLRQIFPAAEIHLVHGRTNSGVVPLLPLDVHAHCVSFTDVAGSLALIRRIRAELLIDLTPWPRLTALYAAFSGAATVGFLSEGQLRHFAFDVAVPHRRDLHETDNLRALASHLAPCTKYRVSLRADAPPPTLHLPYPELVLCHVAAGGSQARYKAWPAPHWAQLAQRLAREGLRIGFTGSDGDAPAVAAVLAAAQLPTDKAFSLCGQLSLAQLAGALAKARLFITIDTGVLHLAAALDIRTLALHGPTRSARWGGCSSATFSLNAPHPDAGFIHLGFEKHAQAATIMQTLTVDAVFEAARSLLAAPAGEPVRPVPEPLYAAAMPQAGAAVAPPPAVARA